MPAKAPAAEDPPDRIGRFSIVAEIGRGGMGVVYIAEDPALARSVALKVIRDPRGADTEQARRFLREARAAAAVTHPNIATIYEVGEVDGRVFIAMELVEGRSLRMRLADGALPLDEALAIGRGIASALAKAHEKGIVHRDVKPENVVVTEDGTPKVLDFGLAKRLETETTESPTVGEAETQLTREGAFVGTPAYMSPEQATGRPIDHRSDLFSLGVVLFEMLTGERPFHGANAMSLAVAMSTERAPAPSSKNAAVPPEIDAVVARCLEKSPEARYPSAREIVDALGGPSRLVESAVVEPTVREEAPRSRSTSDPARARKNEVILLERVREFWIEGVLQRSLTDELVLELAKDVRLSAVDRGFELAVERLDQDDRPLDARVSVVEYFERHQKALLVLGEPGAGKTVTLLELTRALLERAERDPSAPLPVVLSLSTYTDPKTSIADWVAEQLNVAYRIPVRLGRGWIEDDRLALMLDGLDEVGAAARQGCVRAINRFRDERGLAPLAVTCRREDYDALGERLKLGAALQLRALDDARIDGYLAAAGPRLAELASAIAADAELRELARSPLMLNIMSLAYGGSESGTRAAGPIAEGEDRRLRLFDRYVERMLRRRDGRTMLTRDRTITTLAWLAKEMQSRSETIFLLEQLQPSSLPTGRPRFLYFLATRAVIGAFCGSIIISSGILGSIEVCLAVTLPLAIVDYRLSRKPPGTAVTWRAMLAHFALAFLLLFIAVAVLRAIHWAFAAHVGTTEAVLGAGVVIIALVLGLPVAFVLGPRRKRLAQGRDIRTVENLVVRWKRFAILVTLFCLGPGIGIWFPFRWNGAGSVVVDTATGQRLAELPDRAVSDASLSPDGRHVIYSRVKDSAIVGLDVATGRKTESELRGRVELDPTWKIAAVFADQASWKIRLVDPVTLATVRELQRPPTASDIAVEAVTFAPDRILVQGVQTAWIFDSKGDLVATLDGRAVLTSDSRYVLATRLLGGTHIHETATGRDVGLAGDVRVTSADIHPSGAWLALIDVHGCLSRIDLASGSSGSIIADPPVPTPIPISSCDEKSSKEGQVSLKFDPTGERLLITAGETVLLLDREARLVKELASPAASPGKVRVVVEGVENAGIAADGKSAIVMGRDVARIFRLSDGSLVSEIRVERPAPWTRADVELSADGSRALAWTDGADGRGPGLLLASIGLLMSLAASLQAGVVRLKTATNQGMHLTLRMSAGLAVVVFVVAELSFGAATRILRSGSGTIMTAIVFGIAFGLGYGGFDLAFHAILRLFLAMRRELPLRAPRFLDDATQQIFLRRVGGGFIFIHRLILEYFARDAEKRLLRRPASRTWKNSET